MCAKPDHNTCTCAHIGLVFILFKLLFPYLSLTFDAEFNKNYPLLMGNITASKSLAGKTAFTENTSFKCAANSMQIFFEYSSTFQNMNSQDIHGRCIFTSNRVCCKHSHNICRKRIFFKNNYDGLAYSQLNNRLLNSVD